MAVDGLSAHSPHCIAFRCGLPASIPTAHTQDTFRIKILVSYLTIMISQSILRLEAILETAPELLKTISEEEFAYKPSRDKWSKKQMLGHLIDSAANNHQRFIRGQFEHNPEIRYDQNKWNEFSYYQQIDPRQLIDFWVLYNRQLIEIIKRIPDENLVRQVKVGETLLSLDFLIADYVGHLEHHLKEIISYQ